jgi:hypothetical protein
MNILPNILTAIPWWPLLVFVIVLMFKREIRQLVSRIREVGYPGGKTVFAYGQASIDRPEQKQPSELEAQLVAEIEQPQADSIKWGNSGNLFWASHDLMLTIDRLLRNAPKEAIFFTLQQSLHHVRELGFSGHPIERQLTALTRSVANDLGSPVEHIIPFWRETNAEILESIKNEIGHLARANQPDFKPGPKVDFPVLDLHP